jgi:hypothetical protein
MHANANEKAAPSCDGREQLSSTALALPFRLSKFVFCFLCLFLFLCLFGMEVWMGVARFACAFSAWSASDFKQYTWWRGSAKPGNGFGLPLSERALGWRIPPWFRTTLEPSSCGSRLPRLSSLCPLIPLYAPFHLLVLI